MAYKSICTPCFRPGFHIARCKQASYPGGRDGVQYANARLSGLVFHRSHCHIDMAYNALEYIFAALLDAPLIDKRMDVIRFAVAGKQGAVHCPAHFVEVAPKPVQCRTVKHSAPV